jgi:hypothetical protein
VPRELDRIVLKMLAREPADRYQTCDEMLADMAPITRRIHGDAALMREFMHQLGPLKPPLSPVPSSMPTVVPTHPPARLTLAGLRRQRRNRALFAGGGVAAGLLLVILLLTTRHQERPAPAPLPAAALQGAADTKATVAVRELVPAPAIDRVRLSLTGPTGAEATLDGKLIGTLPIEVQLPRLAGVRKLMVRAPGSKPWIRVVAGDVDIALKVATVRLRAPDSSPSSPKPSRRSPTSVIKDPFAQ